MHQKVPAVGYTEDIKNKEIFNLNSFEQFKRVKMIL